MIAYIINMFNIDLKIIYRLGPCAGRDRADVMEISLKVEQRFSRAELAGRDELLAIGGPEGMVVGDANGLLDFAGVVDDFQVVGGRNGVGAAVDDASEAGGLPSRNVQPEVSSSASPVTRAARRIQENSLPAS